NSSTKFARIKRHEHGLRLVASVCRTLRLGKEECNRRVCSRLTVGGLMNTNIFWRTTLVVAVAVVGCTGSKFKTAGTHPGPIHEAVDEGTHQTYTMTHLSVE